MDDEKEIDRSESRLRRKELLELLTAVGTVGAALAAGAAAVFAAWQATITDSTAKLQLRAYISVTINEGDLNKDHDYLSFSVENIGQTPAYDIGIDSQAILIRTSGEKNIANRPANEIASLQLGNGQKYNYMWQYSIQGHSAKLGEVTSALREEEGSALIFKGHVSYRDIFAVGHRDSFCYRMSPSAGDAASISFSPCATDHSV